MMPTEFPDVNGALYLWRDRCGVVHASDKMTLDYYATTACGQDSRFMDYAGRDVAGQHPTCLACVTAP